MGHARSPLSTSDNKQLTRTMKLIFLGSGSAFTIGADNFQSNMLLVSDRGNKLLIDCGSDIRFSLHAAGFGHLDITDIYISHLHADHAGGLEYIGFSTKFDPRCNRPNLYLSKDLASELWDRTLSGGMRSIEGDIADLETFFEVHSIGRTGYFTWEGIEFNLVRVVHVNNGYFIMPAYGLFFEVSGVKVLLTTDTQLCLDELGEYYERADIIFQDCETSRFPSSIHAHYQKLLALPERIRNKMWLYHYQPGPLPDAKKDGFCGFVKRGQTFELSESLVSSDRQLAVQA
jgi:ribonuclease BN (tRNA processing enzyme)